MGYIKPKRETLFPQPVLFMCEINYLHNVYRWSGACVHDPLTPLIPPKPTKITGDAPNASFPNLTVGQQIY